MTTQNIEILKAKSFEKALKQLKKRFKNIENDVDSFLNTITSIDDLGTHLGNNTYKVRISNSDKQSGKSGGYRLISYVKLIENELYLLYIYDKSDYENISEKEIDTLILNSVH